MIQNLLQRHFGVAHHPHSIAILLHNSGFSSQKARCVCDPLNEATRLAWHQTRWPKILRQAKQRTALLLFGDEASIAPWGSPSYTWALQGQQPEFPTSGKRKAYKGFGLIDSFPGQFCYKTHAGRFNSASYTVFLLDVLSQTTQPVVVMQDGAHYHMSTAMQMFFETHTDRLTIEQLPDYSLNVIPIEHLWEKVKKEAMQRTYFPAFTDWHRQWTGPCSRVLKPPMKSQCSWIATVRSSGKRTKQHRSFTKLSLKVYRSDGARPRGTVTCDAP
jgi:hypothetical protein